MDSMVTPSDLSDFPGAPFSDQVVRSAEAAVRSEAGWHIAPVVTETITLYPQGHRVFLPSLRILSVLMSGNDRHGTALGSSWRLQVGGLVWLFSDCFDTVQATITHGFDSLPDDLLPVVASRASRFANDRVVASEQQGPFRTGFTSSSRVVDETLRRYCVGAGIA